MTLRRLSVNLTDGEGDPPSVGADDETSDDVILVDRMLDPSPVPVGPGKVAIRLSRRVIRDAGIG
jgi:hypothetical protein